LKQKTVPSMILSHSNDSETLPTETNGIEERMEEADAKERGLDADMESETQGKLNAGGDDHGYLDVAILPDQKLR
jgi:hypothetical protein